LSGMNARTALMRRCSRRARESWTTRRCSNFKRRTWRSAVANPDRINVSFPRSECNGSTHFARLFSCTIACRNADQHSRLQQAGHDLSPHRATECGQHEAKCMTIAEKKPGRRATQSPNRVPRCATSFAAMSSLWPKRAAMSRTPDWPNHCQPKTHHHPAGETNPHSPFRSPAHGRSLCNSRRRAAFSLAIASNARNLARAMNKG